MIHKTAIIDSGAQLSKDVEIGPYVVVEKDVKIASGVRIEAHAYIYSGTEIGNDCRIHTGSALGGIPQDLAFKNKPSFLKIGKRNIFREYTTAHRGTTEGSSTIVGDDNYIMTCGHIGHNCNIGNKNIIASSAVLGGYVTVEDNVFIGGNAGIHQFTSIGKLAMMAGGSLAIKDVPPYMLVKGDSIIRSLNTVGLKRSNIPENIRNEIKKAYKILYRSNLNTSQALRKLEELLSSNEIRHLINFIKNSKRGICSGPRA